MRVLHVASMLDKHPSGINEAVATMMRCVRQLGGQAVACSTSEVPATTEDRFPANSWPLLRHWDYAHGLRSGVLKEVQDADVIHAHNLWLYPTWVAAEVARTLSKPLVLSLHGMLEVERLQQSPCRKRLILQLYGRRLLRQAAMVHVTSAQEAEAVRNISSEAKVEMVPLGVAAPEIKTLVRQSMPAKRKCLFLSRISPIKGLDLLVEAVAHLRPARWVFEIAGPEEGAYGQRLRMLIDSLQLNDWFQFSGPVAHHDKWQLLRDADLFVLPSRNENFALSVAEALAMECPVLTTDRTPWSVVQAEGCGWQVAATVEGIRGGLQQALQLSDQSRLAMGRCGRALYEREFTELAMGKRLWKCYERIISARR